MSEQPRRSASASKEKKPAKKRKKRKISGRAWFYSLFFTAVLAVVCGMIGYLLIILNGERLLEEHGSKLEFGEASIIYDAQGNEISRLFDFEEHREVAEFEEIPLHLREAIVATEDQRFYEHSGLDFWAIGRAVVKDVIARSAVEGGSTITQQLAKNVFLSADKTFFRKATEASIAVALEQQMSKDDILALYLNRIYFGKGVHGVKAAAKYYFGKELSDLELWESATIAAMPKAPNRYNPVNDPEASKNRRAVVLKLLYDQGYITEAEMNEAKEVDYVRPASQDLFKSGSYAAFVDYVLEEAIELTGLSEEELRVGGFHIYTTLNQQAQKAMDEAFDDASNFETSIDDKIVQGSMVIIDHRTGEIQALSGGREYEKRGWNRAVKARQPGSAIKPIVAYGPALETGKFFPWTILDNDQKCFSNYCPTDRWGATPVSMTQAMKDSRNLAAVWMLNEVGIRKGMDFAEKLGIVFDEQDRNLSIALGGMTRGASPMQMAVAYSVIANGGMSVDAHAITRIKGKGNYDLSYKAPKAERLMSVNTANYLTEMLQAVIETGGTGTRAAIDRPVAGKTGTTQHGIPGYNGDGIRDAWFVGYTPEWTASVWMGYDETNADHLLAKGSAQSAALFAKVMQPAMKNVPKGSFHKSGPVQEEEKPPAKVQNFRAEYDEATVTVRLLWDPVEGQDITYEVFRRDMSETDYIHFDYPSNTSVTDLSVMPNRTYQYYVVAYDPETGLASEPSNAVTVEIPDADLSEIPDIPAEPDPVDPVDPEPGDGGEDGNTDGDGETPIDPGETEEPVDPIGTDPIPTEPASEHVDGEETAA